MHESLILYVWGFLKFLTVVNFHRASILIPLILQSQARELRLLLTMSVNQLKIGKTKTRAVKIQNVSICGQIFLN